MRTPLCSAMAFTMKLGPFPMYVFAPMKTDPMQMAAKRVAPRSVWRSWPRSAASVPTAPLAAEANVR